MGDSLKHNRWQQGGASTYNQTDVAQQIIIITSSLKPLVAQFAGQSNSSATVPLKVKLAHCAFATERKSTMQKPPLRSINQLIHSPMRFARRISEMSPCLDLTCAPCSSFAPSLSGTLLGTPLGAGDRDDLLYPLNAVMGELDDAPPLVRC
jgi:hypothetical protein